MEAFSFTIKTILFTVFLVWALQFKFDHKTAEKHFLEFVRTSKVVEPLHRIAEGSRRLTNDGWSQAQHLVNGTTTSTKSPTTRKASTFKWSWDSDESSTTENFDRETQDSE